MSSLLKTFPEMTAILLNTRFESQIPKKSELKTLLDVEDVYFYKRGGPYSEDIKKIEDAMHIVQGAAIPDSQYLRFPFKSTCIVVTNPNVEKTSFFKIKHADIIVDGFYLDSKNWEDLLSCLKNYAIAVDAYFSYQSWIEKVKRNTKEFDSNNIFDTSVTQIDLERLQEEQSRYGVSALQNIHGDIASWIDRYRWK